MKHDSPLLKRLASYSVFASALLAAKESDSQIVYHNIDPDMFLAADGQTGYLDLNNDSIFDLKFRMDNFVSANGCTDKFVYAEPINGNLVFGTTNDYAMIGIHINKVVGPALSQVYSSDFYCDFTINEVICALRTCQYYIGSGGTCDCYSLGPVTMFDDRFLAMKLNWNGENHYGWVRLITAGPSSGYTEFYVKDYAYNTIQDSSLVTGQIDCSQLAPLEITPAEIDTCAGNPLPHLHLSSSGDNIDWYQNNMVVGNANDLIDLYINQTGDYYAIETLLGCVDTSNTVHVTIHPNPAPIISIINQDTLHCSVDGGTYQWYQQNTSISGATDQNYVPTETANYNVEVYDSFSCYGISSLYSFNYIPTQVSEPNALAVPIGWFIENHLLTISISDFETGLQLSLVNPEGKEFYRKNVSQNVIQIPLQNFPAGIYCLVLQNEKRKSVFKILID